jgi:poly(beta-D-mannuronate) lyase
VIHRRDRLALLTLVLLGPGSCATPESAGPRGTGGDMGEAGSGEPGTGGKSATGGKSGGTGGAATGGATATGGSDGGSGGGGAGGAPPIGDDWPACRKEVMVDNAGALGGALSAAAPGDCLLLADGSYGGLTITAKGRAEAPIVLRARNRGKVTFTGAISFNGAASVGIDGANFSGGANVSINDSNGNRISRGVFTLAGGTFVTLIGNSTGNRIDHNEMGPITGAGEGHFVTPTGLSEKTRIDHNHFHDNPPSGGNGRESIRLGCCGAMFDAHETGNIVEHNLFVNCDGESEMIGMKSSLNTVRYNTIRASRGQISFRAGKKNQVYGNYILGEGKDGTQGIRMLDENHLVYNNYVDVTGFALRVQNGDVPGFPPVKNATIVNNTFIVRGAGALELGGTAHSVPPASSIFQNNLIWGMGTLIKETSNPGLDYKGNIAFSPGGLGATKPVDQFRIVDPMMVKVGEVMKPAAGSPVAGAGVGSYPFVTGDIDEQPRAKYDVGAHAVPAAQGKGPLTAADVGPNSP